MPRQTIDISLSSILKVIGVLLGLWFLYLIRDILLLLFIVIIIVMALTPLVDRWQQKMPRALAVAVLFILILAAITTIVSLILPPLIDQVSELAYRLPQYSEKIQSLISNFNNSRFQDLGVATQAIQTLSGQLAKLSQNLIQLSLGFLGGFVSFLTVLVLSIYMLFEEKGIRNFLVSLLPTNQQAGIANAVEKVGEKLGGWLRGQLLLMLIIGLVTGLWTSILGLPYTLALGLWAGLTEIIPYLGPILGGIPIILLALLDSPFKALLALILIILVQQIESQFIVPKVMQRSVGLSPVVVILALLIGGKLFGITGTMIAVPLAAAISVVVRLWPQLSRSSKG